MAIINNSMKVLNGQKLISAILIITSLVMGACNPFSEEDTAANCSSGETFNSSSRTCEASLTESNNAPLMGSDQTTNITEGTTSTAFVNITLSSATDADGDTIYYRVVTAPSLVNITECVDMAGSTNTQDLTCRLETVDANVNGWDSFTYIASDGKDDASSVATVSVYITPTNDTPIAAATSTVTVSEASAANISLPSSTDPDSDTLTYGLVSETSSPAGNATTLNNCIGINASANTDLECDYDLSTTSTEFNGLHTVVYRAGDPTGTTADTTLVISVAPVNDAPVFVNSSSSVTYLEDQFTNVTFALTMDEGGDTYEDSQNISVTLGLLGTTNANLVTTATVSVDNPAGDATAGTSTLSFDIAPDENGLSTYAITLYDDGSSPMSTSTNFTLSITAVSDNPVFTSSAYFIGDTNTSTTITEGEYTAVTLSFGVDEGGASDEDAQSMSIAVEVSNSSIFDTANITYNFTDPGTNGDGDAQTSTAYIILPISNTDVYGTVTATIFADDQEAGTSSAVEYITLNITGVNDSPTFTDSPSNITINYLEPAPSVSFRVTEGGTVPWEINQDITLSFTTSSSALLDVSNIQYSYSNTSSGSAINTSNTGDNCPTGCALGTADVSVQEGWVTLNMTMGGGYAGTVTVTVQIDDSGTPSSSAFATYSVSVHDIFAIHNGWTNIKSVGNLYNNLSTVVESAYNEVHWPDFTVYENGIATTSYTYSVFRSTAFDNFDYDNPLASGIAYSSSGTNYVDVAVTPGATYFYEIRPVASSNSRSVPTASSFNKVRIVTAPDNFALLHRWMANKEVCTRMNAGSLIDSLENNRCPYKGPGAILDSGDGNYYYDIGRDTYVAVAEASCHYSLAPECSSSGCIYTGVPIATDGESKENLIAYSRTTGKCYRSTGAAGGWEEFSEGMTSTAFVALSTAFVTRIHLPPLAHVGPDFADDYCANRTLTCAGAACGSPFSSSDIGPSLAGGKYSSMRLLTRQEQIAAAAWNTSSTDNEISNLEDGANLLTSGECNTNGANNYSEGIISTDDQVPPPSFLDTLPYAYSSTGYALRTYSNAAKNCVSRYGIRDMVGNVAEYSDSKMSCTVNSSGHFFDCHAASGSTGFYNASNLYQNSWSGVTSDLMMTSTVFYSFAGLSGMGPGGGVAGGSIDGPIDEWTISDIVTYTATGFYLPAGLPTVLGHGDITNTAGITDFTPSVVSTEFTASNAHGDVVDLNMTNADSATTSRSMIFGGDWADGVKAGRWTLKMSNSSSTFPNYGFRCGFTIAPQ